MTNRFDDAEPTHAASATGHHVTAFPGPPVVVAEDGIHVGGLESEVRHDQAPPAVLDAAAGSSGGCPPAPVAQVPAHCREIHRL
jgi:hypothetical protein